MSWFMPSKIKDDFYITILKYASQRMGEGGTVHLKEVIDHVRAAHPKVNEEAIERACFGALERLEGFDEGYKRLIANERAHILEWDAYFQLLEYTELQEARRSSTNAMRMATVAIVISTIFAAIQVSK